MSNRPQNFPAGGAYLVWNGATWIMSKAWKVTDDPKTFKSPSNTLGDDFDERIEDLMSKISCDPKVFGTGLSAQLALLFPYTNPSTQLGQLIFPAADLPAEVYQRDLKTITYPAAQITKMPDLMFASNKPLIGPMELTCLLAATAAAGAAGSHDVVATAGSYAEPQWNPGDELFDSYTCTFNGATAFTPDKDGVSAKPVVTLEPIKPAAQTTVNYRITGIGLDIEFRPLDMDVDAFYATYFPMEGANVALGGSIRAAGNSLIIAGSAAGKAKLTVPLVAPYKQSGPAFDNKEPRIQKVTLRAMTKYNTGWQPLFTLGTV